MSYLSSDVLDRSSDGFAVVGKDDKLSIKDDHRNPTVVRSEIGQVGGLDAISRGYEPPRVDADDIASDHGAQGNLNDSRVTERTRWRLDPNSDYSIIRPATPTLSATFFAALPHAQRARKQSGSGFCNKANATDANGNKIGGHPIPTEVSNAICDKYYADFYARIVLNRWLAHTMSAEVSLDRAERKKDSIPPSAAPSVNDLRGEVDDDDRADDGKSEPVAPAVEEVPGQPAHADLRAQNSLASCCHGCYEFPSFSAAQRRREHQHWLPVVIFARRALEHEIHLRVRLHDLPCMREALRLQRPHHFLPQRRRRLPLAQFCDLVIVPPQLRQLEHLARACAAHSAEPLPTSAQM